MQSLFRHQQPFWVPVLLVLLMLIQVSFFTLKAADPEAYLLDDDENHAEWIIKDTKIDPVVYSLVLAAESHDHPQADCLECITQFDLHQMVPYSLPMIAMMFTYFIHQEFSTHRLPAHLTPLNRPPSFIQTRL